jgi:hypothetical protein
MGPIQAHLEGDLAVAGHSQAVIDDPAWLAYMELDGMTVSCSRLGAGQRVGNDTFGWTLPGDPEPFGVTRFGPDWLED